MFEKMEAQFPKAKTAFLKAYYALVTKLTGIRSVEVEAEGYLASLSGYFYPEGEEASPDS